MCHLGCSAPDRVHGLERADDLTSSKDLHLEPAIGGFAHIFGEDVCCTVDGVEGSREAGRKTPSHVRHGLGNRGSCDGYTTQTHAGRLEELATLHGEVLP